LPLLSAGTIATVAAAATAAPVPSAATTTTAAYFSAAGYAASMFPLPLPLFPLQTRATASFSVTAVPPLLFLTPLPQWFPPWQLSPTKSIGLQVLRLQRRTVAVDTMVKLLRE
jgi:hypothetical protein